MPEKLRQENQRQVHFVMHDKLRRISSANLATGLREKLNCDPRDEPTQEWDADGKNVDHSTLW